MSVVITNYEMPECCDVCLFSDWSNLHQTCSCKLKEYEPGFQDFSIDYRIRRSDICPLEERKKGKWKGYNANNKDWQRADGSPVFLICSECGATVVNNFAARWNYCCSCGADMRTSRSNFCPNCGSDNREGI